MTMIVLPVFVFFMCVIGLVLAVFLVDRIWIETLIDEFQNLKRFELGFTIFWACAMTFFCTVTFVAVTVRFLTNVILVGHNEYIPFIGAIALVYEAALLTGVFVGRTTTKMH